MWCIHTIRGAPSQPYFIQMCVVKLGLNRGLTVDLHIYSQVIIAYYFDFIFITSYGNILQPLAIAVAHFFFTNFHTVEIYLIHCKWHWFHCSPPPTFVTSLSLPKTNFIVNKNLKHIPWKSIIIRKRNYHNGPVWWNNKRAVSLWIPRWCLSSIQSKLWTKK